METDREREARAEEGEQQKAIERERARVGVKI